MGGSSRRGIGGSRAAGLQSHTLAWAALSIVAAILFGVSFQRWGHPIIDLGRDLYLPSQLLGGKILYRDLLYNYGPVAPYLLAAVIALFGDSLAVFASFGIVIGALVTATLYAIGVRLGGVANGFAVALIFVTLSFFANSTWGANFVLPYAFAATLGTLFSLGSFLFINRYLYGGRSRSDLALSLILLLAALFTKAEIGLAIGLVHVVAWWTHRLPLRPALAAVASGSAAAGLMALLFSARGDHEHALWSENLGKFASGDAAGDFFSVVAGTDAPLRHLGDAGVAALGVAVIVGLAALAGHSLEDPAKSTIDGSASGSQSGSTRSRATGRWIGATALAACAAVIWIGADVRWMRIVPLVSVVSIAVLLRHRRRDPLLLVAVYALGSVPRIVLQYQPLWYGFYLAVPGYLLLTYGLGLRLPRRLAGLLGNPGAGRSVGLPATRSAGEFVGRRRITVSLVTAALAATMLLAVVRYSAASWRSWSQMTSVVRTDRGTLRDLPIGRAEAIGEFLAWWRDNNADPGHPTDSRSATGSTPSGSRPGENTLIVLPEGVSLNYFTGSANPTAYYLFTPPEIGSSTIERRMLAELEVDPPEFVIVNSRDLTEFGYTGIGIDYALEIGDWLRSNYSVERWFLGPKPDSWRLLLLRRTPPGSGEGGERNGVGASTFDGGRPSGSDDRGVLDLP